MDQHVALVSNTSLADTDPALQWIVKSLLWTGMFVLSIRVLIRFVLPWWYCSHRNRSKTALRACSSSGLGKVSSLRLVFLLSSDDPGPWDPRDPVAVEPSLCPKKLQDLAESGLLEPEAAPASRAPTRAATPSTDCSMFVIFVCDRCHWLCKRQDTVCKSAETLYKQGGWSQRCEMGLEMGKYLGKYGFEFFLHCTGGMTSHFFKIRKRTVRRTQIRRGSWCRRYRHICSVAHSCHGKREPTKLGCRHLDKTKPETLAKGKNTAHVRTRNGLSQNVYGWRAASLWAACRKSFLPLMWPGCRSSFTPSTRLFSYSDPCSRLQREICR